MTTPIVTAITRRLEAVGHDTFIDDLRSANAIQRDATRQVVMPRST